MQSKLYNKIFGGSSKGVFELILAKKEFLILVFANLILQLCITYIIMEKTTDAKKKYNFWLLLGISLVILIVLGLIPMHPILKFAFFSGFSYIFGIILSFVKEKHNEEEIQTAIESALSIFAAMFITALGLLAGGVKLGYKFGMFLFFALLALILARIFTSSKRNKFLSMISVVLFSLYVLYDTHVILQKDYSGDFISASMAYYLDIVNIFRNLLRSEE